MIETNTIVSGVLDSESTVISRVIGSHVIVDIGTIQSVSKEGFATVTTGRTAYGEVITYSNVELMYIGNKLGSLQVAPAGSTCLLFCPKTVMPSSENGAVTYTAQHYSVSGMKAIPLTHGGSSKCHIGITPSGSITLAGGSFSTEISTEGLNVYSADGTTQVRVSTDGGVTMSYGNGLIQKFIGADGSINEVRFADDGKVMYFEKYELSGATTIKRVSEGPVKLSELNSYDKWAMVNTYLPDGTVTDDTNNNSGLVVRDADGNIVSTLTLASTGDSSLMGKNAVKMDCMNKDDESQASVLLDTEGNITVTAMKTLNVDIAEGKFTLGVTDAGALTISGANGNFTLEVADSGTLSVTATQECTITDGSNTIAMSASGVEITDVSGNTFTTSATGFEIADAAGSKVTSSPAGLEMASSMGTKITLGPIVQIG